MRPDVLSTLRARIARIERGSRPATAPGSNPTVLPFAVEAIDRHLPYGGLACGAVHELQGDGPDVEHAAAPACFAAGILARHPGPIVWIGRHRDVFGHGLAQAGLNPRRIVFVAAGKAPLLAAEEALRHPDVAGVVCELEGRLDLVASRRLQLAAEASDVLGLIIRRSRRFKDPALSQPSAATTRWRIAMLPSPPPLTHAPTVLGLHRPLWRLELLRCRGGEAASWIVEGCDAQGHLALAPILADRSAAAAPMRRAAG